MFVSGIRLMLVGIFHWLSERLKIYSPHGIGHSSYTTDYFIIKATLRSNLFVGKRDSGLVARAELTKCLGEHRVEFGKISKQSI